MELDEYFRSGEVLETSELSQVLDAISHIINCLLRLSIAIRDPAPYDQFRSRVVAESAHLEFWDIRHVSEKFPNANNKTAERLGRAMTLRRQYFKYREEHHGRLAEGLDPDIDVPTDGATTVAPPIPGHLVESSDDPLTLSDAMANLDDALSDASGTSYAASQFGADGLTEPPIPKGYNQGPIKCPFCQTIIQVDNLSACRKHFYRDLRPYVCLAEDCRMPDRLYSRRREWVKHMELEHWRVWTCPLECTSMAFSNVTEFGHHVVDIHGSRYSVEDLDALANLSSNSDPCASKRTC
ncbi:hypothetical protein N656DRAFT_513171 [Canariomyces notabilis]|uniref:C2H2-type domain-containing protein n=1 Tax=Canariomyces notabilis TaxID=2074819 RepID=A0AAN6T859_9PEZI|nr:hypothetical protein N656DRAFT_513171 [Canariomyces arenarius]